MKKIVRLSEKDLTRIVKKALNEQEPSSDFRGVNMSVYDNQNTSSNKTEPSISNDSPGPNVPKIPNNVRDCPKGVDREFLWNNKQISHLIPDYNKGQYVVVFLKGGKYCSMSLDQLKKIL